MAARPLTEAQFFEQVRSLLNLYGWRWIHQYDSRRSNAGWPDIFAVREGRAIAIELKREGGKPTQAQLDWLESLNVAGIRACLVYPKDIDMIRELLAGGT